MGVRRLAAAFSPSIMPKFARNQLSYECFRANIIFVAAQLAAPHLGNQESIRERSKQARSEAHFQALGTTSPPLRSPPVSFGLHLPTKNQNQQTLAMVNTKKDAPRLSPERLSLFGGGGKFTALAAPAAASWRCASCYGCSSTRRSVPY